METVSTLRIALYYVYVDLPDSRVQEQVEFHRTICEDENLTGRIRISAEGINGVLSGELEALRYYEQLATNKLGLEEGSLNVKYCMLRGDIPVKSQIFNDLMVKKTVSVISLFETEPRKKNKNRRRGKQEAGRRYENDTGSKVLTDDYSAADFYLSMIREKMKEHSPAQRLNPKEWHEYLSDATDPLLLDCRNVYESRVGYFASENAPTLLTNTRKYSDLPKILANSPHVQEKQEIFMYCTVSPSGHVCLHDLGYNRSDIPHGRIHSQGGVRCERVSMLIQSMYPQKKVFQLHGGIQMYLEVQAQNDDDTPGSKTANMFRGKNFVFDPRRVDPLHGAVPVIGKCMLCEAPHDDYDNGHAPSEQKEARCNICRMLILVCSTCRQGYACWGEEASEDRPFLYCGINRCIHEGAAPEPQLILSHT
jgi:predicted sulfurtransferase